MTLSDAGETHSVDARSRGIASSSDAIHRFTTLAARLVDADDAHLSLTEDLELATEPVIGLVLPTTSGPLVDSLCSLTFESGELTAIPDTRADPRSATLPEVDQADVAAYLGVPLIADDDAILGTLCLHSRHTRPWSDHDRLVARELADTIVNEIARTPHVAELGAATAGLARGYTAAAVGSFDWNLRTDALVCDERVRTLFGFTDDDVVTRMEDLKARIHPEDLPQLWTAVEEAKAACGEYRAEYRALLPDGSQRWLADRGQVICDDSGEPERLLGATFDTTSVRDARETVARVLEMMSNAYLAVDRDWRFTYVNAASEWLLGAPRSELLGADAWEVFPELVGTVFEYEYRTAVETQVPVAFEAQHPSGQWFGVQAWPSPDGLTVYFDDITAQREAEAERRHANDRLQRLADAGDRLASSLDPDTTLATLVDLVVPEMGAFAIVAVSSEVKGVLTSQSLPPDENSLMHIRAVGHRDDATRDLLLPLIGFRFSADDTHGPGFVARTGRSEWIERVSDETLVELAADEAELQALRALHVKSVLTVPLRARGRNLGALLVTEAPGGALDRRLVEQLADRAAISLDNAVLHESTRQVALTLQRSMLPPRLPQAARVEIAARYLPGVATIEVGGDLYLAQELRDGRLMIAIGDVVGRGVEAAARMGQLRSVIQTLTYRGDEPDRVLDWMAVLSHEVLDLSFATLLIATYDPASRRLSLASAGHPPPLLAAPGDDPHFIDVVPGRPLGVEPAAYQLRVVDIPPEATLVFYTDGLIERRDQGIDEGMEVLRQSLAGSQLAPEVACDHVLAVTDRESGGADDIALLVMSHPSDSTGSGTG